MDFLHKFFGKEKSAAQSKSSSIPPQVARLMPKMKDSDPLVRMEAVKALGKMNHPTVLDVLEKVYENKGEMGGIREAALDGIERINPKWQPNISGAEILEQSVSQLVALYDQTKGGEGYLAHSVDSEPVREIGQRLYELGRHDLMVLAHRRFKKQRPNAARNLEFVWDGIGAWES